MSSGWCSAYLRAIYIKEGLIGFAAIAVVAGILASIILTVISGFLMLGMMVLRVHS